MVLPCTSSVPVPKKYRPPPRPPLVVTELPETVLFCTVRLPPMSM
jgi:hypothetical protein